MIRLGINTMVWTGRFDERQFSLLDRLREWGYDAIEVAVFDLDSLDSAAFRTALSASGLAATVTAAMSPGMGLGSADPAVRRKTREWVGKAVEKTAALGGTILAGAMYLPVGELTGRRRTEDEWNRVVDEYRILAPAIHGSGVRIAIEPLNRFETYFLNTAADAHRLCAEIGDDSIGVLFDTFHANIEEEDVAASFRSLGCHLIHVHFSENHRGVPGCGHVPFGEVIATLRDMNYDGYAVVESFATCIPEIARATAMWRDYADSSDHFAQRTIENLRPLLAG